MPAGNKSSQLAALVGARGTVVAVERDATRAATLRARARLATDGVVEVHLADFLAVDVAVPPFCDAACVLLDPSCSGSGIVERARAGEAADDTGGKAMPGGKNDDGEDEGSVIGGDMDDCGGGGRLRGLAAVQLRLLLHALSFPRATAVSYSTCSVHALENEVVATAAARHPDVIAAGWALAPAMPAWPCRGLPLGADCEHFVRSGPEFQTNGFFVARFERDL